jgi:predicted short-subunit dehydrogenase-like oxidoreductase (DUF2520 family)
MTTATHLQPARLRIGLFGSGRVATQLAPALLAAGHELVFIGNRTAFSAQVLAATLPGPPPLLTDLTATLPAADLYLLAVPDAAVADLLRIVAWPVGAQVAHLAGALPLRVFEVAPKVQGGVFYPLQTFSAGRAVTWAEVPVFVEAATPAAENTLMVLAHSLSGHVERLSSSERLQLHVGAVFANNFTNHLLGISYELLQKAGLSFQLLAPLIRETVDKALTHPPFTVQTGPATRQDIPTLAAHRQALAEQPRWQQLYEALTLSIQAQRLNGRNSPETPNHPPALS